MGTTILQTASCATDVGPRKWCLLVQSRFHAVAVALHAWVTGAALLVITSILRTAKSAIGVNGLSRALKSQPILLVAWQEARGRWAQPTQEYLPPGACQPSMAAARALHLLACAREIGSARHATTTTSH